MYTLTYPQESRKNPNFIFREKPQTPAIINRSGNRGDISGKRGAGDDLDKRRRPQITIK
jgi:hypothetical protein